MSFLTKNKSTTFAAAALALTGIAAKATPVVVYDNPGPGTTSFVSTNYADGERITLSQGAAIGDTITFETLLSAQGGSVNAQLYILDMGNPTFIYGQSAISTVSWTNDQWASFSAPITQEIAAGTNVYALLFNLDSANPSNTNRLHISLTEGYETPDTRYVSLSSFGPISYTDYDMVGRISVDGATAPVPEPSSLLTAATGLAALGAASVATRRRCSAASPAPRANLG